MLGLKLSDLTPEVFEKILDAHKRVFGLWDSTLSDMVKITYLHDIHESFSLGMSLGIRLGSKKFSSDDSKLFVRGHKIGGSDNETIIYFEFYVNSSAAERKWPEKLESAEKNFEENIKRILQKKKIGININLP